MSFTKQQIIARMFEGGFFKQQSSYTNNHYKLVIVDITNLIRYSVYKNTAQIDPFIERLSIEQIIQNELQLIEQLKIFDNPIIVFDPTRFIHLNLDPFEAKLGSKTLSYMKNYFYLTQDEDLIQTRYVQHITNLKGNNHVLKEQLQMDYQLLDYILFNSVFKDVYFSTIESDIFIHKLVQEGLQKYKPNEICVLSNDFDILIQNNKVHCQCIKQGLYYLYDGNCQQYTQFCNQYFATNDKIIQQDFYNNLLYSNDIDGIIYNYLQTHYELDEGVKLYFTYTTEDAIKLIRLFIELDTNVQFEDKLFIELIPYMCFIEIKKLEYIKKMITKKQLDKYIQQYRWIK